MFCGNNLAFVSNRFIFIIYTQKVFAVSELMIFRTEIERQCEQYDFNRNFKLDLHGNQRHIDFTCFEFTLQFDLKFNELLNGHVGWQDFVKKFKQKYQMLSSVVSPGR